MARRLPKGPSSCRGAAAAAEQELGHPLERADLVLSLERLNQVVEYVPADMTITVQAGMRLAALQALTASHRPDPSDRSSARRSSYPRRHCGHRSIRNRRMASEVCARPRAGRSAGLGGRARYGAGGKVVKNVAGYDMPKLVIGSLGTIGIVTEVSLRLHPLPADRRTLLFGFADSGSAIAAAESILNSELLPAAVTILSPAAARRLETPGTASLAVALEETAENNGYQADRLSG